MALIRRGTGSGTTIAVLTFGLMANLAPMATFAAVMPEITEDWGLTASEAGWIGGIYFGGYAACVPILAGATDKIDARWVFVGCSLLGALASFIFAGIADGFWMALVLRFLSGAALAGVHMPGLKLLVDRVAGRAASARHRDLHLVLRPRQRRLVLAHRRSSTQLSAGARASSRAGSRRCWRSRHSRCCLPPRSRDRPRPSPWIFVRCCATGR